MEWHGGEPHFRVDRHPKHHSLCKGDLPWREFSVENAHYNFKTGGYSCFVTSPISEDTAFSIDYGGGKIWDRYESEVGNRFSTYRRLDGELDGLVEKIVQEQFPHKVNLIHGTLEAGDDVSRPYLGYAF